MARNLRAKIPESDTLVIYDTNTATTQKFLSEAAGKNIEVASLPKDVAERSVSLDLIHVVAANFMLFISSLVLWWFFFCGLKN